MQEDELQEIQKDDKTENLNSENDPDSETLETVPEVGAPEAVSGGTSDEILLEISGQLAEMLEKFDEQEQKTTEESTIFFTPSGQIAVSHEISLGHLIIATLLLGLAVFNIFDRLIRR